MIRMMLESDYDAVYALWEKTGGVGLSDSDSREAIEAFLKRNPELSYIAIIDNKVAGTILCGQDGRRGYIHHLAVDEAYRGIKLGRKLVVHALMALKKQKIDKCHLFVYENNEIGRSFWSGTGWEQREDLIVFSHKTDIQIKSDGLTDKEISNE